EVYRRLFDLFGPQHWWPAETPFEVVVGAILTQNTNWKNVERAIENLKREDLLDPHKLRRLSLSELAELIRPAGYYNIKAKRLKNLLVLLCDSFGGDLERVFSLETQTLRETLCAVKGIGPETADSIILYGAKRPIFVVDSYTHRVFSRHGLIPEESTYEEIQELFHQNLPWEERLFNEYHALIVRLSKSYCLKRPKCKGCPLEGI
ncbi:MAG: endonuclease III domain-containing protein, partial [Desulfatiglandales bacterium]